MSSFGIIGDGAVQGPTGFTGPTGYTGAGNFTGYTGPTGFTGYTGTAGVVAWGSSITSNTGTGLTIAYTGTASSSNRALAITSPSLVSSDLVKITSYGGWTYGSLSVLTADTPDNSCQFFIGKTDGTAFVRILGGGGIDITPYNGIHSPTMQFTLPTSTGGLSVLFPASTDDGLEGISVTSNNTQSNQHTHFTSYIGTSGNVQGLFIKGTGSTTGGIPGTGKNHMTLWGNTTNNANHAFSVGNGTSYTEKAVMFLNGNLVLGASALGSTAANGVFALSNGATAPTTSVDLVHLYSADNGAGHATLALYTEEVITTEVVVCDTTFPIFINGTKYRILLHT